MNHLKAYLVIAGLILVGIAIGKSGSKREVIYVVRK